jgi:hypothetical protein
MRQRIEDVTRNSQIDKISCIRARQKLTQQTGIPPRIYTRQGRSTVRQCGEATGLKALTALDPSRAAFWLKNNRSLPATFQEVTVAP